MDTGTVVFNHAELAKVWHGARGEDWRYVPELDEWRHWREGEGWVRDADGRILMSMSATAMRAWRKVVKGTPQRDREKQGSVATARGGMKMAETLCSAPLDQWDTDPDILGSKAGMVYDLAGGTYRAQEREDLVVLRSGAVPSSMTVTSDSPTIRWLQEKFPNDAHRRWVRMFVGSLLSGDTSEQVALWLHGPTSTGKSTFMSMVEALLGEYAFTISGDLLAVSKFQRSAERGYTLARGPGRRVLLVNEWQEGAALDSAFFCSITGCDTIHVREIRRTPFDYRPQFKVLVASNELPQGGLTPPVMRRLVCIEMAEGHKDRIVPDTWLKLTRDGLADFAAWALAGYREWKEKGLRPLPESDVPEATTAIDTMLKQAVAQGILQEGGRIGRKVLAELLIPHAPPGMTPRVMRDALAAHLTVKTVQGQRMFMGYSQV